MIHYLKYYIMLLLILPTIIGILLGGHWMWLGFVVLFIVVVGGDALLNDDISTPEYKHTWILELPIHLALPMIFILLVSLAWSSGSGISDFLGIGAWLGKLFDYDFIQSRNGSVWVDYLGAVIGTGFLVAGYGTNAGHELCHRLQNRIAIIESRWLLSASCNADFTIEHVFGHHFTVGTEDDPATARRGENIYKFFPRSTIMGHISAWKLELKRLKKKHQSPWFVHNKMFTGYAMSLCWIGIFYAAAGLFSVILFLGQAFLAKFLFEAVNYMEHYGLTRRPDMPVRPEHSWNTNRRMSSMVLFSLTRHSSHHEKPKIPYWVLDPYTSAPQMPFGYLTTFFLSLVPPLWYRIMEPRLEKWYSEYASVG